jgi:hypothetical protein
MSPVVVNLVEIERSVFELTNEAFETRRVLDSGIAETPLERESVRIKTEQKGLSVIVESIDIYHVAEKPNKYPDRNSRSSGKEQCCVPMNIGIVDLTASQL